MQLEGDSLSDSYSGSHLRGYRVKEDRRAGDTKTGRYNVAMTQGYAGESMDVDYERRPSIGASSGLGGSQGDKYEAMRQRKKERKLREEKQLLKVCSSTVIVLVIEICEIRLNLISFQISI